MGECQLTGGDTLKDVLCVPTFKFNLLSVSKMTKDLKCCVTFFPQCIVFQDLFANEIGKEEEGLYVLSTSVGGKLNRAFAATSGAGGADLWHKRT